jgi:hypothetical protein
MSTYVAATVKKTMSNVQHSIPFSFNKFEISTYAVSEAATPFLLPTLHRLTRQILMTAILLYLNFQNIHLQMLAYFWTKK